MRKHEIRDTKHERGLENFRLRKGVMSFVPEVRYRIRTALKHPEFATDIASVKIDPFNFPHVLFGE